LLKYFKGAQQLRQLEIFDALFESCDIGQVKTLFHALPRCPKHECGEQEFVGDWDRIVFGGDGGPQPVESCRSIRINGLHAINE